MADIRERLSLKKLGQALAVVAAVVHLIFNYVHTNALVLLENEICGFYMFMFILMGLVALFETTRMKEGKPLTRFLGAGFCVITDVFGWLLVNIYQDAILNQKSLADAAGPVKTALWLSVGVMIAMALAAALFLVDGVAEIRKKHG